MHLKPTECERRRVAARPSKHYAVTEGESTSIKNSKGISPKLGFSIWSAHHIPLRKMDSQKETNRTIMENARCMLEDSQIGKEFWGYAVLTAAHIHNRLTSRSHNDKSPLEYWTGKLPEIGHLRVFGSTTWLHIPTEKRQKLDAKSVKCILVRYEEDAGSRVYRRYNPIAKKVILSRDVIVDESQKLAMHK